MTPQNATERPAQQIAADARIAAARTYIDDCAESDQPCESCCPVVIDLLDVIAERNAEIDRLRTQRRQQARRIAAQRERTRDLARLSTHLYATVRRVRALADGYERRRQVGMAGIIREALGGE